MRTPILPTYSEKTRTYVRALRQNQTIAEIWLWKMVRAHRFSGFKFRRQVPIGPFIVDFYCHDGGQHNVSHSLDYDAQRSDFLRQKDLRVIRFWNNEALDVGAVLNRLCNILGEQSFCSSSTIGADFEFCSVFSDVYF